MFSVTVCQQRLHDLLHPIARREMQRRPPSTPRSTRPERLSRRLGRVVWIYPVSQHLQHLLGDVYFRRKVDLKWTSNRPQIDLKWTLNRTSAVSFFLTARYLREMRENGRENVREMREQETCVKDGENCTSAGGGAPHLLRQRRRQ